MAEAPDGGPDQKSSGLRIALLAIVSVLLLAGGFALGRATGDEGSPDEPSATATADTGGNKGDRGGYLRIEESTASYGPEDVVAVFPPTIVRDGEILNEKKGGPQRALLEWWQAYQFSDIEAVKQLTSPETIDAIGENQLEELIALPGPGLGGVEVFDASVDGNSASVNAGLLNFQPEGPDEPVPTKPTSSTPETFAMQRQGGDWLFAQPDYLESKLASLPE